VPPAFAAAVEVCVPILNEAISDRTCGREAGSDQVLLMLPMRIEPLPD
jgi:hypothetical protein